MSLINVHMGPSVAYIVSDTLVTSLEDHSPCGFTSKTVIIPHLHVCLGGRGSLLFFDHLSRVIERNHSLEGVDKIKKLFDINLESALRSFRRECAQMGRPEADPGKFVLFAIGRDLQLGRLSGFMASGVIGNFNIVDLPDGYTADPSFSSDRLAKWDRAVTNAAQAADHLGAIADVQYRLLNDFNMPICGGEKILTEVTMRKITIGKIGSFPDFNAAVSAAILKEAES